MSFINNSVNYSQTMLLKTSILSPLLKDYNNFLLKSKNSDFTLNQDVNTGISYDFIIPNNNNKYYLLVTRKTLLEQTNTNYNILYFFPSNHNGAFVSDFYLESNKIFEHDLLLEGYLYKNNDKYDYLLTDILIQNKDIINVSYDLRITLLNEILFKTLSGIDRLKDLNNHMTINIHPIFNMENENLVSVFKNNFIHKAQICSLERVSMFEKQRFIELRHNNNNIEKKTITMGEYTDVYNVYDVSTNNMEGILYIKGIRESSHIKNLFKQKTALQVAPSRIILDCSYNVTFYKWQPIFNFTKK